MLSCMFDLPPLGDRFGVVGTKGDHPAVKKRLDLLMTGGNPLTSGVSIIYRET
jgi:hypothetical protein